MTNTIPINGFSQKANNPITTRIQNFQDLLLILLTSGANPDVIIELRKYVRSELEKGNDPYFSPTNRGLYVDKIFFFLYPGLNGSADQLADSFAQSSGDPTLMAVSQVVDFDRILGNFSNIFSNGFDLSCWGASYSKSMGQKDISLDFPFMLDKSGINQTISEATINKFSMLIDSYLGGAKNGTSSKFAKCTRDGYALVLEKGIEFKKTIFDSLTSNSQITLKSLGTTKGSGSITYPGLSVSSGKGPHNLGVWPITQYKVQTSSSTNQLSNNNNSEILSNSNNNANPNVSTSSIGGLALAGLALFAFIKLSSEKSSEEKENLKTA